MGSVETSTSDVIVRRLKESDADQLRESPQAFGATFEEDQHRTAQWYADLLRNPYSFILGVFQAAELIGMLGFRRQARVKRRHKGMIWGMFVRKSARGRGIGRALLEDAIMRARKNSDLVQIQLSVVEGQDIATKLYASLGFKEYGRESRAFFADGEYYDERLLALDLD